MYTSDLAKRGGLFKQIKISERVINDITEFYQDDENRLCPHKKDWVSSVDRKAYKQKRLILLIWNNNWQQYVDHKIAGGLLLCFNA